MQIINPVDNALDYTPDITLDNAPDIAVENVSDSTLDNVLDTTLDNVPDDTLDVQLDFFCQLEAQIQALDDHSTLVFGNLEYGKDFTRYYYPPEKEGAFGKTLYKLTPAEEGDEPSELSIVMFGEICSSFFGTAISARGNHYAGTAEYPKALSYSIYLVPWLTSSQAITDDSVVKDIIILRPLTGDTGDFLRDAFTNQIAGLEEIPNEDGAYETPLHSTKPVPPYSIQDRKIKG